MLIGYARVSKADGSQVLDLQLDVLKQAGVGFKVLTGQGAEIDTTTAAGKLVVELPNLTHCLC